MTHILQPLDVSFFSSLKSDWDSAQEDYCLTRAANGQFVTRETFCQVSLPARVKFVILSDDDGNALETAGVNLGTCLSQ